jgi:putative ABC transport system permease protein
MFYKLAFKNVSKSIKDYTVYFLTLAFGVCVFYVFNSIDSQQAMLDLSSVQHTMVETMMIMINGISVFISFILAFLILYANKFMMRRRKRELGTYMILGMPKGKISMILMAETAVIGIIALAAGLVLGIFLSQGLAVLTARLFEVQIKSFQFVFSSQAFGKTILYFVIIFVVVMLFNSTIVSRCKLITLLNAEHRNERLRVKRLWVSVVLFLISAACLGGAYYLITKNGMMYINGEFWASIVLGSIGTFLFFMSLSGFLLRVLKSSKHIYYKNLNMFVLRQINSKINTTHISMTFICIMLLLALGILTVGGGMQRYFGNDIASVSPYDMTLECYEDLNFDFDALIQEETGKSPDELFAGRHQFLVYDSGISTKEMTEKYPPMAETTERDLAVFAIGESDYNRLLAMMGKQPISLSENQYTFSFIEDDRYLDLLNGFLQAGDPSLQLHGETYTPAQAQIEKGSSLSIGNDMSSAFFTLVLPDEQVAGFEPMEVSYNAQYKGDKYEVEEFIIEHLGSENSSSLGGREEEAPPVYGSTRLSLIQAATGLKATMLFLAIYMGIIFLIASAAVLALQQLSEASDNVARYKLLGKLGVERKTLNHAIYAQVAIYFFIPLALAVIHAFVGVNALQNSLQTQGAAMDFSAMFMTAACLLVIYGGYFLATCFGCKNIAKGKLS